MNKFFKNQDILRDRYCKPNVIASAQEMLTDEIICDSSEDAFLGAQGVLLLNGLL